MERYSYEEAKTYLTDYWWFNPQEIVCFKQKYFELAEVDLRLPNDPVSFYRNDIEFFAFSSLFGEERFTLKEAKKFCSEKYSNLSSHLDLQGFYKSLRKDESRLPSAPYVAYREDWTNWAEFFNTQQLNVKSAYYSLDELKFLCIEKYKKQKDIPINLQNFFQCFKHEDEKIPKNPYKYYGKTGEWKSWQDLFGLEVLVRVCYKEAKDFCVDMYQKEVHRPTNLATYYLSLRETYREQISLPRHPESFYAKTNEWQSFKSLFDVK
jgi:hypothetical protein